MQRFDYLIAGGGMAAAAAVEGIREHDGQGTIGIVSQEPVGPYARPPLSKGLWTDDDLEVDDVMLDVHGAEVLTGRALVELDPANKEARDDRGGRYGYGKMLIATGGRPILLPEASGEVIHFRTLTDYRALRELSERNARIAVIGGSFIGSELAAALAMKGRDVTMVFPENGVCSRLFPRSLTNHVTDRYRDEGVRVLAGDLVTDVVRDGALVITTRSGETLSVDGAVAGIGIAPNVQLAEDAGLRVDDGIVVDEHLRTSAEDVYAAGDVARFEAPGLGPMRVEHEDNALSMGRTAGEVMAGADTAFRYLPFFYSDLFDMGYEAVGRLSSELETVEDWHDGFDQGVVYYLDGGRVRGVLLWNVWGQTDTARELIASSDTFTPDDLKGRIGG